MTEISDELIRRTWDRWRNDERVPEFPVRLPLRAPMRIMGEWPPTRDAKPKLVQSRDMTVRREFGWVYCRKAFRIVASFEDREIELEAGFID